MQAFYIQKLQPYLDVHLLKTMTLSCCLQYLHHRFLWSHSDILARGTAVVDAIHSTLSTILPFHPSPFGVQRSALSSSSSPSGSESNAYASTSPSILFGESLGKSVMPSKASRWLPSSMQHLQRTVNIQSYSHLSSYHCWHETSCHRQHTESNSSPGCPPGLKQTPSVESGQNLTKSLRVAVGLRFIDVVSDSSVVGGIRHKFKRRMLSAMVVVQGVNGIEEVIASTTSVNSRTA